MRMYSFQGLAWSDAYWGNLQAGHQISAPDPVFKRIDENTLYVTESEESPVAVS